MMSASGGERTGAQADSQACSNHEELLNLQRLSQCYDDVLNDIDAQYLMPYMLQKGALTLDDKNEINNTKPSTRWKRNEVLLDIVLRGKHDISTYDVLIEALKEKGYTHVAEKLAATHVDKEFNAGAKKKDSTKKKKHGGSLDYQHVMNRLKEISNKITCTHDQKCEDSNQDITKNDYLVVIVTSIINPTSSLKAKEMKLSEVERKLENVFTTDDKKITFKDIYHKPLKLFIEQNLEKFDLINKKGNLVVKLKMSNKKSGRKCKESSKMTVFQSDEPFGGPDQSSQIQKTDEDQLATSVCPKATDDCDIDHNGNGSNEEQWVEQVSKRNRKTNLRMQEKNYDSNPDSSGYCLQKHDSQSDKTFVENLLGQNKSDHLIYYPDDNVYKRSPSTFMKDVVSMWNTPSREKSLIVLGVKCQTSFPHEVIGLQVSNHNDFYQSLFKSEYFTNKPEYDYTQYDYDDQLVGVITVLSSLGKELPSVVNKNSVDLEISKGQLWARRNKENEVIPQENSFTAQIYQWFNLRDKLAPDIESSAVSEENKLSTNDLKTTEQISENVPEFASAVSHLKKGHFVLVSGESPKLSKKLETLALVPWIAVYDFDRYTRDKGLLSCLEDVIKKIRCLHVCTWKTPPTNLTEFGTQWYCLRGLREIPDTDTPENPVDWLKKTKTGLDVMCGSLEKFAEDYTVLKIVILWPDNIVTARFVCKFLGHLDGFLGPSKLVIICFEEPKEEASRLLLEMLISDHKEEDVVKFSMHLDQLCFEVKNLFEMSYGEKQVKYTLPIEEGHANYCIDEIDACWLREDMDVLYESNPYTNCSSDIDVLKKMADSFFHGGTIHWFAWYEFGSGHLEVERDIMHNIVDHINEIRKKQLRSQIITLFHAPGGGGTTLAQRILWELHRAIPCAEVRKRATVEGITEKITFLHDKTNLPVLVLVDGDDESRVKQLVKCVKSVCAIFLYVKRYPYQINDLASRPWENKFWLKGRVSHSEANKLALKFADRCQTDTKKHRLHNMSRDVQQKAKSHYVFEFGMTVYHAEFKGVASYVRGYLCLHKNPPHSLLPWQKILAYLSLVYYYGQSSMPCQFFGNLLSLPSNYDVDIDDFPFPVGLFVVEASSNSRTNDIRMCHYLVAKEILEHILNPLNKDSQGASLSEHAKRGLKDLCFEFITYASQKNLKTSLTSVTIKRVFIQTFIFRDNRDVGENETQIKKKPLFSQIVIDVDSDQPYTGRLQILEKLTCLFPEDPNFQAHLGRFYAYCRPDEDDKAEACFKHSLHLCEPQIHGKEIKDIDDGMKLSLMRIYHMYGMIFKGRVSRYTGKIPGISPKKKTSAKQFMDRAEMITSQAEMACNYFRLSREYKPQGHDEIPDYAFSSEIMVRLHVCDFVERNYKDGGMIRFLSKEKNHPAAKFIQKTVSTVEDLVVEFYSVVDPDNIHDEYRKALQWYHFLFKKHTSKLTKMFPVVDISSRRMTIAAMKLKYLKNGTTSVFEENMSTDDVGKLVHLYEGNFKDALTYGEPNKRQLDGDYKEWLFAIRNPAFSSYYSVEDVLTNVHNWQDTVSSPSSMFYLFICKSLIGFGTKSQKGNSETLLEAQIMKDELQKVSKSVWRPRYPREWLGKDVKGIKCLITNNRIGHFEDHIKRSSLLEVRKGTVRHPNKKPLSGYIDLDLGDNSIPVQLFFIPLRADLQGPRYAGERVQFHLAFTLDHGYEAFAVSLLKKFPCSFCGHKTEILMDEDSVLCDCGMVVNQEEMDVDAEELP